MSPKSPKTQKEKHNGKDQNKSQSQGAKSRENEDAVRYTVTVECE